MNGILKEIFDDNGSLIGFIFLGENIAIGCCNKEYKNEIEKEMKKYNKINNIIYPCESKYIDVFNITEVNGEIDEF